MGLDVWIQELAAEGLSGRRIAAQIKIEQPDVSVSDSAIIRYVSKLRKESEGEAFGIIRKHVDKVIPEDLEVLEEMEAQCLAWAREAGKDRLQIQRDKAMNTAIKIIEIKLRHAGLLDEEGKSPIYIVDRTGGKVPEKKDGFAGYKPYAIDGGKKDG